MTPVSIDIPPVLERLAYRYPSVLVDAVTRHEPGRRIVAVKNVTVSEEFFQGHFPGTPLLPAVLMIESLTQVATLLLAGCDTAGRQARLLAASTTPSSAARWCRVIAWSSKSPWDGGAGRLSAPAPSLQSTDTSWPRRSW